MISQVYCIPCQEVITLPKEVFLEPVALTWIFSFAAPHLTTPLLPTQPSFVIDGAHVADKRHLPLDVTSTFLS